MPEQVADVEKDIPPRAHMTPKVCRREWGLKGASTGSGSPQRLSGRLRALAWQLAQHGIPWGNAHAMAESGTGTDFG